MTRIWLPWLALTALALGTASLLRVRLWRAFPLALCALAGVLYVPALFGGLAAGFYGAYALALVGFAYFLVSTWARRRLPEGTVGALLVWALCFAFSIYQNAGRRIVSWDEFTHWGLAVKSMTALDALSTHASSIVTFKDYPPAMTLIQYFFTRSLPAFSEDAALVALNLVYFSLALPLFSSLRGKRALPACGLLFFTVLLLPTALYPAFYTELYVDAILGLLMAAALLTYFTQGDRLSKLSAFGLLALLTLTKSSGAGLAGIALCVMGADAALYRRESRRTVLAATATVAVAYASWKAHTALAGAGASWATGEISLSALMRLGGARKDAALHFLRALGETELTGYLFPVNSVMAVVLFLFAGWGILRGQAARTKRRGYTALGALAAGGVIYAASLLTLYLFVYSEYEAVNLASFGRYMMTYALALTACAAGAAIRLGAYRGKGAQATAAVFLCLCALSNVGLTLYHMAAAPVQARETAQARASYAPAQRARELLQEGERLYILSPVGGDYDWWLTRYDLMLPDAAISPTDWTSVGTAPYGEEDIYTRVIQPEDWAKEVAERYAYVYLCWAKEAFVSDFGHLFPQGLTQQTLYRVTEEAGELALVPAT